MKHLQTILHVEDEPDIREIAAIGLAEVSGYTVTSCATPTEALEAGRSDPQPDLILLDVMMPEMDGPALLARLRELPGLEQVPVAFVTAKTDERDVAPLKALGAMGVLAKPFDPMTVGEKLQSMWDTYVGSR